MMIQVKTYLSVGRHELTEFVQEQVNLGWELKMMVPYLYKSHTTIKHPESDEIWSQVESYTLLFSREVKEVSQSEPTAAVDTAVTTRKRK
jgi:hypothetical protein